MLLVVFSLAAFYFFRFFLLKLNEPFTYHESEIARILQISDRNITVVQHESPTFSPSLEYTWQDRPNEVMFKIWFTEKNNEIVMDVYLTEEYRQVIAQDAAGAKTFINTGIINAYIASLLDTSNFNLQSFCNESCVLDGFNTIENRR